MYRFNILSIILCSLVIFNHINSYEAARQGDKRWLNHGQRSSGGKSYSGRCTYYNLQGGITACGSRHSDNEYIVAMNAAQFDPHTPNGNPNRNSLCGKKIRVKGPRGSAVVTIVDECPGCPYGGLDLSPAAFKAVVGDLGIGTAQVTWQYL